MSVSLKGAAVKTARWATVPAIAATALGLAAGPALAEGTSIGITTYSGYTSSGQLNVSGAYQCSSDNPYDHLAVTAVQQGPNGPVTATEYLTMPCTDTTLTWQATIDASGFGGWFGDGPARVTATLWAPGDWDGRATSSMVLWA